MCPMKKASPQLISPRQNGRQFEDDSLKRILMNESFCISNFNYVSSIPKGPIDNTPTLVH